MSIEELDNAIGQNKVSTGKITASDVANIMDYVNMSLELDRNTLCNYYRINVKELLDSEMPVSDLETLKSQGWAYDTDKESVILYF